MSSLIDRLSKRLAVAGASHGAGDLTAAAAGYRDVLAVVPALADPLHLLGVTRLQLGHTEEAEILFRRALRLNPRSAGCHHNLATALRRQRRYADAVAHYARALGCEPQLEEAVCNLWLIMANVDADALSGLDIRAIADVVRHAVASGPGQGAAMALLGLLEQDAGNVAAAAGLYRWALAIRPDQPNLRSRLWHCEKALGWHGDYHSADGQDAFVHRLLADAGMPEKGGGVFLDIGAFDGLTGSNTAFFERTLGWSGLCLEPAPQPYGRLVRNRRSACLNVAAADVDGEADFMEIVEGPEMVGGLVAHYDPGRADLLAHGGGRRTTIRVPVRRLTSILEERGLFHIDYCSIDTEGSEEAILDGLDLQRFRVTVFSIENNAGTADLRRRMSERGYDLVYATGTDEIYRRRP